jgi:hypothetical protein
MPVFVRNLQWRRQQRHRKGGGERDEEMDPGPHASVFPHSLVRLPVHIRNGINDAGDVHHD